MTTGLPTAADVLAFWFARPAKWWKKNAAFDVEIRERFLALHEAVDRGGHEDWLETPRGALAYVIVLDQFSRNMFRGTARSFASDTRARAAALRAVERGDDRTLSGDERLFLYMPFMHSENLADQDRSCALFAASRPDQLRYAEQHRGLIRRFGRFPHRNAILGRAPTPDEEEFLKQPGEPY
jgi:uncharacterized protein (DUF924 family)